MLRLCLSMCCGSSGHGPLLHRLQHAAPDVGQAQPVHEQATDCPGRPCCQQGSPLGEVQVRLCEQDEQHDQPQRAACQPGQRLQCTLQGVLGLRTRGRPSQQRPRVCPEFKILAVTCAPSVPRMPMHVCKGFGKPRHVQ